MAYQAKLADRLKNIKPSPTLAITAKAKQMKADGIDVVGFGAGEPDFDTPVPIKDAAKKALDDGFTKYTVVGGIPELKNAIVAKFKKDNGLEYDPTQILVSCGGKHSFFNWALATLNDGDEVVIPAPYWVSYPDMCAAAGAVGVVVETDDSTSFKMTPEQLEKAITPKTRAVVVNSPSNPTGMAYTEAELKALADVIEKHDNLAVVSDEIYEHMVYDGFKHASIASMSDEMKARTMVLNGVSKAYSMTGWRIGYAAGDAAIIKAMTTIQGQSTSNPASISQKASVEALTMDQAVVGEMVKAFDERRIYIVDRMNAMEGITCLKPNGAFYVFPNVSHYYSYKHNGKPLGDSEGFAKYLLESVHVAVVAGWGFGGPNCVRLSYATSMEQIKKGLDRIEEALGKLENP